MRYFILNKTNKKFKGNNISDVAKKVAKYLFANTKRKNIKFCIKEITKTSKRKSYKYTAKKINSKLRIKKIQTGGSFRDGDYVTLYDTISKGYLTYDPMKTNTLNYSSALYKNKIFYGKKLTLSDNITPNSIWRMDLKSRLTKNYSFVNINDNYDHDKYLYAESKPAGKYVIYSLNSDDINDNYIQNGNKIDSMVATIPPFIEIRKYSDNTKSMVGITGKYMSSRETTSRWHPYSQKRLSRV